MPFMPDLFTLRGVPVDDGASAFSKLEGNHRAVSFLLRFCSDDPSSKVLGPFLNGIRIDWIKGHGRVPCRRSFKIRHRRALPVLTGVGPINMGLALSRLAVGAVLLT